MATTAAADTSIHGEEGTRGEEDPKRGLKSNPPQPSPSSQAQYLFFTWGEKSGVWRHWWMFSHRDWIEDPETPSFPASLPDSTYADHHRGRESPNSCEVEHENRRPSDRRSVCLSVQRWNEWRRDGSSTRPISQM